MVDAELALAAGEPSAALAAVKDLAGRRVLVVRGRALLDLGKTDEAAAELGAAAELAPEDLGARVYRAMALGASDPAAVEVLDWLAAGHRSTLPRLALGQLALARGETDAAIAHFEAASDGNPHAYRARTQLADLYVAAKRAADAEAAARGALQLAPSYGPARAALGRILLARGDTEGALVELRAACAEGAALPPTSCRWRKRWPSPATAPARAPPSCAPRRRARPRTRSSTRLARWTRRW